MFEVFSESTRNYLEGGFYNSVKLFNEACGRGVESKNKGDLIKVMLQQCDAVREETMEAFIAYPFDKKEMLDGVVDMLYTICWYDVICKKLEDFGVDFGYDENLDKLNYISGDVYKLVFGVVSQEFDEETIIKACKLICANNSLKYTSDEKEFNTWRIPTDCHRVSYTVDGVKYFSIKDATGKTRKHLDFEKVVLDNIII